VKFIFELKLKGSKIVFKEGMNPGALVSQEVEYDVSEEEAKGGMFIKALLDQKEEFVEEFIEVIMTRKED